jgi:hypothetical protein
METMAKKVEASFCVLLCVSEQYRQSATCQAEAQYSRRLNKPLVSLIMQPGYEKVKGWLGEIMQNRPNVNFSAFTFGEAMKQLKQELSQIVEERKLKPGGIDANQVHLQTANTSLSARNSTGPELWTENQVKDWFLKNNVNVNIYSEFFPCAGNVLRQL